MDKRILGLIGLGGIGALMYYAFRGQAKAPTPSPAPTGCKDGSTKCIGTNLYVCKSGKWYLSQPNSTKCGYKLPSQCTNGQTTCEGYNLYVCQSGKWVLSQKNSSKCGYKAPSPAPSNKIVVTINNPTPYYVGIAIDNKPSKVVHSGTVSFTFSDTGKHLFRFYLLRTPNTPYGINVKSSLKYSFKQEFLNVGKSYIVSVPKYYTGIAIMPTDALSFLPFNVKIGNGNYENNTNIETNLYPNKYDVTVALTKGDYMKVADYSSNRILPVGTILTRQTIDVFPDKTNYFQIWAMKKGTGAIVTEIVPTNSKGEYLCGNITLQFGNSKVRVYNPPAAGYAPPAPGYCYPKIHYIYIINIPAGTYPFKLYLNGQLVHSENTTIKDGKLVFYMNKSWVVP